MTKENFADLFEKSIPNTPLRSGTIIDATVIGVDHNFIVVNAGLKSESLIAKNEFIDEQGQININVGDVVKVALIQFDNNGETILSRETAKRSEAWERLELCLENKSTVIGIITGRVKGGMTVEISGLRAFLPSSLIDTRSSRDASSLEGKPLEFKVIKLDKKRNNIVVSRRAVLDEENSAERASTLENINEGQVLQGTVKNLTDYGAFVDLGGIDGLLHKTDISWSRVNHPGEVLNVGDELTVIILKIDRERGRVSLGMKQLAQDPWVGLTTEFPKGAKLKGQVTNITDYGCFVEIKKGVEGLVHQSEMDWTNKNIPPNKLVQVGQEVEVMILDIDEERRRISLGLKQCIPNPWEEFAGRHNKGDQLIGTIKSITDFGIFIGLEGEIDGLVHASDISWTVPGETAIRDYKKGQEITVVILAMDPERERISLGIKQLETDHFSSYAEEHPKGSVVDSTVKEVEGKNISVELAPEVVAQIRSSEVEKEPHLAELSVGTTLSVKIIQIDKKNRSIMVSTHTDPTEAELTLEYSKQSEGAKTTLGDIFKEQMENQSKE